MGRTRSEDEPGNEESSAVTVLAPVRFMNSILPRYSIVDFPAYSPASNLAQVWIRATLQHPISRFILNIADKQQLEAAVYLQSLIRLIRPDVASLSSACGSCFVPLVN
jgi:hypothetical protein